MIMREFATSFCSLFICILYLKQGPLFLFKGALSLILGLFVCVSVKRVCFVAENLLLTILCLHI